jgi:hypothetical protein
MHDNAPARLSREHSATAVELPDLSPHDSLLFLPLESVLNGKRFARTKEVAAEATRALADHRKWFPGIFVKALGTLFKKSRHNQRELLRRQYEANICKFAYYSAITQFRELFEASSIYASNYSQNKKHRIPSSGMLRRVALVRTCVSDERSARWFLSP